MKYPRLCPICDLCAIGLLSCLPVLFDQEWLFVAHFVDLCSPQPPLLLATPSLLAFSLSFSYFVVFPPLPSLSLDYGNDSLSSHQSPLALWPTATARRSRVGGQ